MCTALQGRGHEYSFVRTVVECGGLKVPSGRWLPRHAASSWSWRAHCRRRHLRDSRQPLAWNARTVSERVSLLRRPVATVNRYPGRQDVHGRQDPTMNSQPKWESDTLTASFQK